MFHKHILFFLHVVKDGCPGLWLANNFHLLLCNCWIGFCFDILWKVASWVNKSIACLQMVWSWPNYRPTWFSWYMYYMLYRQFKENEDKMEVWMFMGLCFWLLPCLFRHKYDIHFIIIQYNLPCRKMRMTWRFGCSLGWAASAASKLLLCLHYENYAIHIIII